MFQKLKILADHLEGMSLQKEAIAIKSLSGGTSRGPKIFMHIAGPAGSGKTTLLEKIKKTFPDVAGEDLDLFDEMATEALGLPEGWKHEGLWNEESAKKSYEIKQKLLEDFVRDHAGKKIIFVGFHEEGDQRFHFDPKWKISLSTSPEESAIRRRKRDFEQNPSQPHLKEEDLHSFIQEGEEVLKNLKSEGYTSASPEAILRIISQG
jgi:hypothetical protein